MFIFKAEDGIRDTSVTGVQTCALPILEQRLDRSRPPRPRTALVAGPRGTEAVEALLHDGPGWLAPGGTVVLEIAPHRSEERRVGKDCRVRRLKCALD